MSSPPKRRTRALFWDIDGTLLVTGRAGMIAWERAFGRVTGGRSFPVVRPDGLTDHQIAAWLLGYTALDEPAAAPEQAAAAALVAEYQAELGAALPLRQGRLMDNARDLLEWTRRAEPPLLSLLVTGNTSGGAAAKLRHYGLDEYFTPVDGASQPEAALNGAFSTRVEPRAQVASRALSMAQARMPGLTPAEVLVIGDTPHDIEGAHTIGIPVLAVATNVHSLDELAAHHPWRLLPALPPIDEFEQLLNATT